MIFLLLDRVHIIKMLPYGIIYGLTYTIMTMAAFVRGGPTRTNNSSQAAENKGTVRSSPRVASKALDGVERAKIITEQVNREGVGSAERHPVPAGINFVCDVCQVVLNNVPVHDAHWVHACTGTLHVLSDVLTATPN